MKPVMPHMFCFRTDGKRQLILDPLCQRYSLEMAFKKLTSRVAQLVDSCGKLLRISTAVTNFFAFKETVKDRFDSLIFAGSIAGRVSVFGDPYRWLRSASHCSVVVDFLSATSIG